jgi:hypothetical protein
LKSQQGVIQDSLTGDTSITGIKRNNTGAPPQLRRLYRKLSTIVTTGSDRSLFLFYLPASHFGLLE